MVLAVFDFHNFVSKSRKVEVYDDLSQRLSHLRVSIDKIEYLLDMFVVSSNFEGTTVEIIKNDLERLDRIFQDVVNSQDYNNLLKGDPALAGNLSSILNDWVVIKSEIDKLDSSMSRQEILLLHNSVDMNTIMFTERADTVITALAENRRGIFSEARTLAAKSLAGFVLILIASAITIQRGIFVPIRETAATAALVSSGNMKARFKSITGTILAGLSSELNRALDYFNLALALKEKEAQDLASAVLIKNGQLNAVNSVLVSAGKTLSQSELLDAAVKESVSAVGADGAAIYMIEGQALKLKASAGLDERFIENGSEMPVETMKGADISSSTAVFKRTYDFPDASFSDLAVKSGFRSMVTVPLVFDSHAEGFIFLFMKDSLDDSAASEPFYNSIASAVSVILGHIRLFQSEYGEKRFLERFINQLPFGLSVLDRNGTCIIMNTALKRLLGADQRFAITGEYNVYEDDVLKAQGMTEPIRKSYEGYATEFIINYNPSGLVRYSFFKGQSRRLKVKSFPLFDEEGEISNIYLLFIDLSDPDSIRAGEVF